MGKTRGSWGTVLFGNRCCEIRAVSAIACVVVALLSSLHAPLHAPFYAVRSLLLFCMSPTRHTSGTASCLTASLRKPFEFEARSTASNSLLSSPPAQPEASYIAALAVPLVNPSCSVAPLPRINAKPNPFCPCISSIFLAPLSSSHLIFGTLPSRSP